MVAYIKSDLEFILAQIKIAEAHAAGQPLHAVDNPATPAVDESADNLIPAYNIAWGLRTVDGSYNHLLPGQEQWGAANTQFPVLVDPFFRLADGTPFDPDGPGPAPAMPTAANYNPSNNPNSLVFDSSLRTISNLLVDQTLGNPAAILTALERAGATNPMGDLPAVTAIYQAFKPASDAEYQARVVMQAAVADFNDDPSNQAAIDARDAAVEAHDVTVQALEAARVVRDAALVAYGIAMDGDNVHLPAIAPDEGLSAPFNSWFTLFGQFFDHGLDLVNKGGSGTVFIPLQPDDPLYVPGSHTNFMVLTRATVSAGTDGVMGTADDVRPVNTTTAFVDQNQTYTSHSSHQVFLRQYELEGGKPVATGRLIEGANGGMATWGEVKAQALMLGIELTDFDVGSVPLLRTDQYGNFIPNAAGYAQVIVGVGLDGIPNTADDLVVSGTSLAPVNPTTAGALRTASAFLADIAHEAVPVGKIADGDITIGLANPGNGDTEYDNELLDAHFIAGDGRVNENIGLTAVHHVFHAEHNRLVEHTKETVLATNDLAFINEWLAVDLVALPAPSDIANLVWDGERLFQAAKFGTEMQYQHLVFEEFARKIQPNINVFLVPDGFDTTINPDIVAEFAHVVYRFGHSMLTESIARFDPTFTDDQIGLIEGFLNPIAFDGGATGEAHSVTDEIAAGAIIRGMTRQVGNQIDEFVTTALRNNLLGLPLDLATINLARGRDTGVPSLNQVRRDFYQATNEDVLLKPYESWVDFAGHLKHESSIINFIAAYGTHSLITGADTLQEKRDAALTLITGSSFGGFVVPIDRVAFLNATGDYAGGTLGGLENVDLWIGGLAEEIMPFGGMLGSTFNFVFEVQMEKLQSGDRFYYLQRLDGLHLFGEMENNSFAAMIMRNTDATHLPSDVFSTPNLILEVDITKQFNDLDGDGDLESTDPTGTSLLTLLVQRDNPSTPGAEANYLRYTGDDHVLLGGTDEADTLIASIGDDTLFGDAGNDRLEGGFGNDIINGGDGDDIIKDSGGDDNIKAGAGNDVVHAGPGLDLVMGGSGQDFIFLGTDMGSEVFAGEGDDFIYGNKNAERILGNEGNDWIETGTFDGAPGDNFDEIFAHDAIDGHDVFLGDGGFDEFIGEGGDDIMVGSAGRGKMVGMSGFDWATYKDNTLAVNADLSIPIIFDEAPTLPQNAALDEYESMEGLSGTRFNDVLAGTNDVSADRAPLSAGGTTGYLGSVLDAQSIALISGLQAVLGAGVTSFDAGDIILGGDGSDVIQGNDGNDIIDGDKWLNVRIGVFALDANGQRIGPALEHHNSMTTLAARMFSGEINPGQLAIVREITTAGADAVADIDTARYQGARAEYTFGSDANGRVTVTHSIEDALDGSDTLIGIERLQFTDGTLALVVGTPGNDILSGTAGDDLILGLGGNDTLNGLGGNDTLVGGAGTDTLNGGLGDDTYMFGLADGADNINEPVNATSGGTADRIVIQAAGAALTGLNAFDSSTATATGNLVVNFNGQSVTTNGHFTGATAGTGVERINFDSGTFEGYLLGADDYLVSRADPANTLFGLGPRTVNLSASTANNFVAGETSTDNITGGSGNDLLFGHDGNDDLNGGLGDDLLVGGTGSDELIGDVGEDHLVGGAGADLLDGGLDADTMVGGADSDTYVVDDVADVVVEALNAGTDSIETELAVLSLELIANVENLQYTGIDADPFVGTGNELNNVITGGDLGDTLSGLVGNDTLNGGLGSDVLNGGDGNDTLNGGDDDDSLNGGIGADTLNGGAGADTMLGGADNDIYVVNDAGDVVTEVAGAGTDRVDSELTYVLGANVENLTLTGGSAINGSGNALANVINGNGANNQLFGGGDNDTIDGGNGSDLIDGGSGDDTLSGGTGDDTDNIIGGAGNDTINLLAAGGANDVIIYNAAGFGADILTNFDAIGGTAATQDRIDLSALGITAANLGTRVIESMVGSNTLLTVRDASLNTIGTIQVNGITNANIDATDYILAAGSAPINGTAVANTLNGTGGNDTMSGLQGNDTVNGLAGDDTIIWNANPAAPTDGRDVVDGGTEGGVGDSFVVNGNASSEIYRIYTRAAFDAVPGNTLGGINAATEIIITRNGTNATSIIAELREIEEIRVNGVDPAGTGGGAGAGDTFQLIGDFSGTNLRLNTITIEGSSGNDTIDISALTSDHRVVFNSKGGTDTFVGAPRPQDVMDGEITIVESVTPVVLTGNGLANELHGGAGNDTLSGKGGADTLTGGIGNDRLNGGAGNDRLEGGSGNDIMTGGVGLDVFVFSPGAGQDVIKDFDANAKGGQDKLDLRGLFVPENFGTEVVIVNQGNDTLITFAGNGILLEGVDGRGANAITVADFLLN
jgi:Ca2+-binding RTX toxin-like protein